MSTERQGIVGHLTRFCLENKLIVFLVVGLMILMGLRNAPFDWDLGIERDPVPVDAIPDLGENQQIVFTQWPGHSPRDMEDQVTYPLTTALLGLPQVKTVRSSSFYGFSSIYVIFEEEADFYWTRSRILEKLNSLPPGLLPEGVNPMLGPDATALGQVFWYTLEGRDPEGETTGGWDLHELRSIQDFQVRYSLMSASGVAEVASIGGFVPEYQVDVDPDAMRANNVTLKDVFTAVQRSNGEVGARNIEINNVEYFIRGLGFVRSIEDLEYAVVKTVDNVPLYVKDVARVTRGPAQRRGLLDKDGAEVVGGVVTARYGANPMKVLENIHETIERLAPSLPRKTLADGTVSQMTIVPFYDRGGLIRETLQTLEEALSQEILVTVIVILVLLVRARGALMVSSLLPLAVLLTFIAMRASGIDANIVALSGIAIAIGTMVDMGIVMTENIVHRLETDPPGMPRRASILSAASEVGGAVVTAVATTVIGFLPVFTMEAMEGKLFRPLAFTKTYALLATIILTLVMIPPLAELLFRDKKPRRPKLWQRIGIWAITVFPAIWLLSAEWLPLGAAEGMPANMSFCVVAVGSVLGFFWVVRICYPHLLRWAMANRVLFLSLPVGLVLLGLSIWMGFDRVFGFIPETMRTRGPLSTLSAAFPGLGKELMPPLDEGSFLYMPTTSVHAAINEVRDVLGKQGIGFARIPEVSTAVGKLGRAETPLDPAPISMIETVINYYPEYLTEDGERPRFRYDAGAIGPARGIDGGPVPAFDGLPYDVRGIYPRDETGALIPDPDGRPFRIWRRPLDPELNKGRAAWSGIRSPDDIWDAIVMAGKIPGTSSAPRLQPIAARLVMLQTGMRAPMGIEIKGPDLETIEAFGLEIERLLKSGAVDSVAPDTVLADRIVGKPYLAFHIDRKAIARYGLELADVQTVIEVAIGGKAITTTVEGRERYPVRVRYQRELRDTLDSLQRVLVPTPSGAQVPLVQLSDLRYIKGPQVIKSEDTFPISYVLFDKKPGHAEIDVVEEVRALLAAREESEALVRPPGVTYEFAGNYTHHQRATKRLMLVVPISLVAILILLYLQFRAWSTTLFIFAGIAVAAAGGFFMVWLYGQSWFLDFSLLGINLRELFAVSPINMSVAIWVGFLALFGIATDDGVLIGTYLHQRFEKDEPTTVAAIRAATLAAGERRVRAALMTSATTVIALIPVLTSTGRGSDIMKPMAIPTFGGMMVVTLSIFVVPVLFSGLAELRLGVGSEDPDPVPGRTETENAEVEALD